MTSSDQRPTVWAVANVGHDYSSAEKRGDIVFLYEGKVNVFASDKLCQEISDKLKDSRPDDYLITSGNAMACCVAFAYMMRKHGKVNLLIYSFLHEQYEVRTVRDKQLAPEGAAA